MGLRELFADKSQAGAGDGQAAPDLEALKTEARKTRRGGRRTKADLEEERDQYERQAEIEQLFQGENWEEIAALYFNARFAMTGFEAFLLTPDQKKVLGTTLSTTMKVLLEIDPKYVAMIIFGINMGTFVAEKEGKFYAHKRSQRKAIPREIPAGASHE